MTVQEEEHTPHWKREGKPINENRDPFDVEMAVTRGEWDEWQVELQQQEEPEPLFQLVTPSSRREFNVGNWREQAACRGMDPDLFFPEKNQRAGAEAVAACASCPVYEQCQGWAIPHESVGYWGRMRPADRERRRKELGIKLDSPETNSPGESAPCGTASGAKRHWRNGEEPCAACAEAYRAKAREYWHAKKNKRRAKIEAKAYDIPA